MRTDTEVKDDVIEELLWEPTVTSENITVVAKDGVVTLSGTVPNYAEKWAAERATQRVEGVKGIAEGLEVSLIPIHKRTDTEIAEAAVNALKWHVWVPSHVQVKVEGGWVTLTGGVKWGFQRSAAEDAVSFLPGVKGVSNDITMKPSVQPKAIKDAIKDALKRDAEVDAENIDVETDGGKVTLSGSVSSWDEREEASVTAWNAPGVNEVENDLIVSA